MINIKTIFKKITKTIDMLKRFISKYENKMFYCFLFVSSIFFLSGACIENAILMLVGVLVILSYNVLICIVNLKENVLFLFNFAIFLFLLGRVTIQTLNHESWTDLYPIENIRFSFLAIGVSLLTLALMKRFLSKSKFNYNLLNELGNNELLICIRRVSFVVFLLAFIACMVEGIEKINFMQTHTYIDFYRLYRTSQPLLVKAFMQLLKPSLCIYLATFPNKKKSFIVLFLFVITTIPYLIVGVRSQILLACIFSFLYFVIRENFEPKRWIGKLEKRLVLIVIPIIIVLTPAYMYIRNQESVSKMSNPIYSFFYQQGNSFNVLALGKYVVGELPENAFPGYTFGPAYDNLVHSQVGRWIFKTDRLGVQSPETLSESHDLKAHLSYLIMGEKYFEGQGIGTSYLMDVYVDAGFIGIIIYSMILGAVLVNFSKLLNKNIIIRTSFLFLLINLSYIPRSNASLLFDFLFNIYYWFGIIFILGTSKILQVYSKRKFMVYFNSSKD